MQLLQNQEFQTVQESQLQPCLQNRAETSTFCDCFHQAKENRQGNPEQGTRCRAAAAQIWRMNRLEATPEKSFQRGLDDVPVLASRHRPSNARKYEPFSSKSPKVESNNPKVGLMKLPTDQMGYRDFEKIPFCVLRPLRIAI